MIKNNKRKKQGISKRRHIRAVLLIAAMLLTVTAAGCSREPSKPADNPTATTKPTATSTPKPTPTPFIPSDSGGRVTFTGTTAEVSKAQVGDTVQFGSYEQDNDLSNGAEAIEWLVLDKQDGKLLLLSKDVLDCKTYNERYSRATWEWCTLRDWLNVEFYNTAFSQTEQGCILTTKVKNEDNPEDGTEGGDDTKDKVFCLSIGEVLRYFDPDPDACDPARQAKGTAYAEAQIWYEFGDEGAFWWLRSPGFNSGGGAYAIYVSYNGHVDIHGAAYVVSKDIFVRPAFWLNPESTEPTGVLTGEVTPEPTGTSKPTVAPTLKPTTAPSSGTVFIPSGTGGRVTFTGTTAKVSKAQVGDTVRFGNYEQDNDLSNGAEAIEWLVLDKQDGKLLLLSKDALDCKKYNETYENVTWETCTLRSWLNGEFYNTAFSQTEQGRILTTKVKNENNPEYGTEGGNDTEDKVFLLSIEEVLDYFDPDPDAYDDPARRAKVTEYAEAQGAWCSSYSGYAGNGQWWLRSPGSFSALAASVSDYGYVSRSGDSAYFSGKFVRPAFWLNLES